LDARSVQFYRTQGIKNEEDNTETVEGGTIKIHLGGFFSAEG
jgi:hypothetical protein